MDYLELEFGPHGQHLGLVLHGVRNAIKHSFPMQYHAHINEKDKSWTGKAVVPKKYFPSGVNKFNAYAINGQDENRIYNQILGGPFFKTHPVQCQEKSILSACILFYLNKTENAIQSQDDK